MKTIKFAFLLFGFLIIGSKNILAQQVTGLKCLIEYNDSTARYDAKIVITEGSSTSYSSRIQFNSHYTVVVPTGSSVSIANLYMPLEYNATYTGTMPCLWEFGPAEYSPPAQPESDFHSIFPNLSPPSAFNNLVKGDTVTLFDLIIPEADPCSGKVRLFEKGTDPSSLYMPSGGDFSMGYTIGGGMQDYQGNLYSEYDAEPSTDLVDSMVICDGACAILSPNVYCMDSSFTYLWSTGDTISTIEVCPSGSSEYLLYLLDSNGDTLLMDTVFVFILSDVDAAIPETGCSGSTISIPVFASEGNWSQENTNPPGASISNFPEDQKSINFSESANGTYRFYYTISGCSTDTIDILVNLSPGVSLADTTICPYETTLVSSNQQGNWSSSNTSVATVTLDGVVTGNESGTTTLSLTNPTTGCIGESEVLTVLSPPSIQLIGPDSICVGSVTSILPSTGGTWTSDNPAIATITNAGLITGVSPGSAKFNFTSVSSLCQSAPSAPVFVNPIPVITIDESELCIGSSTTLIADVEGIWASTNPTIAIIDPLTGEMTGISEGAATFSFTSNLTGCSSSSFGDIIIYETPLTPVVSSNGPICEGEDIELTTDAVAGATYNWIEPSGTIFSSAQNPVITNATADNSGTYTLVIQANGCESMGGNTDVMVYPIPKAPNVWNNSPLCEGEWLNLFTDAVPDATYTWSGPNGFVSNDQNPVISDVTAQDGGSYCLSVTINGCESEEGCTDVIVNWAPATPNVSSNSPVCEGEWLNLFADFIAGATYAWTGPNGFTSSVQNPSLTNAQLFHSATYNCVITVEGCESENVAVDVVVNGKPDIPIITSNSPVCEGGNINLSANLVVGATYTWIGPGVFNANLQNPVLVDVNPLDSGSFICWVTVDGCDSEHAYTQVIVNAKPLTPIISSNSPICDGEDLALCAAAELPVYTWTGPEGFVSNFQKPIIINASVYNSGVYDCISTRNGCESDPASIEVIVNNCFLPDLACDQIDPNHIICDYNLFTEYSGSLPSPHSVGNQPEGILCTDGDEAGNITWFAFVALEGDYDIVVNGSNCVPEAGGTAGIQMGIYRDCSFTEESKVFCSWSHETESEFYISSTLINPGEIYYMYLDGISNSICDFEFRVEGNFDNSYCSELSKVTGIAYIDKNENGIYDAGEQSLRNALITLSPGNFSVLTNDEGKYTINTPKGGATLVATMNEGEWTNNPITIEDVSVFEACIEGIDFGFIQAPTPPQITLSVSNTVTRCDWETRFYITVENTGFEVFEGILEFEFDDKTSFFTSTIPNLNLSGNKAWVNIGPLQPFERIQPQITLKMPSGSSLLPVLNFKATILDQSETIVQDYAYSEQLKCSYDPNDKREFPNREGEENLTLMDEDIDYTIRFQNNGNDTAFTVKIIDPLDPNIDRSSIRVMNSSHAVETCIDGDDLIFIFADIYLVDSASNYDASQGFVSFRCNTKEGRAEMTPVHNQADIIFDTNAPIITNRTVNTLVTALCIDVHNEIDTYICQGENFEGFSVSGTYTQVYDIAYGCDSIVTINLEVQGITYAYQYLNVCEGKIIELSGTEYILESSQIIKDTIINNEGCISKILTYDIFVNPTNLMIDTTICEGMNFESLEATGIYTIDSFDTATGCIITTTIDLTVLPLNNPECLVRVGGLSLEAIQVHPNPADQSVIISSDQRIEKISFLNTQLVTVLEVSERLKVESKEIMIDHLPSGLYFIFIKTEKGSIYKKLIVD